MAESPDTSPKPGVYPHEIAESIISFLEELRKNGVELARVDKIRGDAAMVIDLHKEMRGAPEDPNRIHIQLMCVTLAAYQKAMNGSED